MIACARAARSCGFTPEQVDILWSDGTRATYPSLWLRDNRPADRDPANSQRLIDIADLPVAPHIASAELSGASLRVRWTDDVTTAEYPVSWLAAHAPGQARRRPGAFRLWPDGASLDARRDFGWSTPATLRVDPDARRAWLARLLGDGLAFMAQVPTAHHEILRALANIGQVLDTNYGRVFDVRSEAQPENLAYTDLGLGLHTDNPYREPVPGFQALHCLIAAPDGGDSLFADGFAMAEHLRTTAPDHFATLTRNLVPFRYGSRTAELRAERPLIELDASGAVAAVHYNNRSIAPLGLPASELPAFYAAYRHFALALREPRFALHLRLSAGDLAVFDNRRVLHGRTAFQSARHPRHLQGCYLSRDSVLSSLHLLERAATGDSLP